MKLKRLEAAIQYGLLIIVALMPLHAFLSVSLGTLTRHEAVIQAWKEGLLVILTLAAAWLVIRDRARLKRLKQWWIYFAAGFVVLAKVVTIAAHPSLTAAAYGLKTDVEFLLAAVLAVLVADRQFVRRLTAAVLAGAGLVIGFGLLQAFVLPPDFLTHFGYGPNTILPYQHITKGTGALRFPSTLGGPNQLGTYLILPLCLALALLLRRHLDKPKRWMLAAGTASGLIVLGVTYSRSAWLGAAAALAFTLFAAVPAKLKKPMAIGLAAAAVLSAAALPLLITRNNPLQYYILHSSTAGYDLSTSSDQQRTQSLANGLHADLSAPLGHGLGTAGPATFHAGTGNIIEDYYLQIGYETGLAGILLFVLAAGALIWALVRRHHVPGAVPAAAALTGVCIASLFLPAWTDSSTALILWIYAGAISGISRDRAGHETSAREVAKRHVNAK